MHMDLTKFEFCKQKGEKKKKGKALFTQEKQNLVLTTIQIMNPLPNYHLNWEKTNNQI